MNTGCVCDGIISIYTSLHVSQKFQRYQTICGQIIRSKIMYVTLLCEQNVQFLRRNIVRVI